MLTLYALVVDKPIFTHVLGEGLGTVPDVPHATDDFDTLSILEAEVAENAQDERSNTEVIAYEVYEDVEVEKEQYVTIILEEKDVMNNFEEEFDSITESPLTIKPILISYTSRLSLIEEVEEQEEDLTAEVTPHLIILIQL